MSNPIIELSIVETQILRARLGLVPLRMSSSSTTKHKGTALPKEAATLSRSHDDDDDDDGDYNTNKEREEVSSLSIDATNLLRIKIGLPPLKVDNKYNNNNHHRHSSSSSSSSSSKYNDNNSSSSTNANANASSHTTYIHAPAQNTAKTKEIQQRVEDAAVKRDAQLRFQQLEFEITTAAIAAAAEIDDIHNGNDAYNFATKMRRGDKKKKNNNNNNIQQLLSLSTSYTSTSNAATEMKYNNSDNINDVDKEVVVEDDDNNNTFVNNEDDNNNNNKLIVGHDPTSFIAGSTTILTLVDTSLLGKKEEEEESGCVDNRYTDNVVGNDNNNFNNNNLVLTNVNMDDDIKVTNNLRKKRMIELGAGRAGGYSGYDDYEFDELGGIGGGSSIGGYGGAYGSSSSSSSSIPGMFNSTEGKRKNNCGFAIDARGGVVITQAETGATTTTVQDTLFGNIGGRRPISLQSHGPIKIASDYYTHDELLLLNNSNDNNNNNNTTDAVAATVVLFEKENKRNLKIVHKLRTKEEKRLARANKRQKVKRHTRRMVDNNSSDDDDDDDVRRKKKSKKEEDLKKGGDGGVKVASKNSLLSRLEVTAVGVDVSLAKNGRQRDNDDDDDNNDKTTNEDGRGKDKAQINENNDNEEDEEARIVAERRLRYDDIMAKGKARSDKAFKMEVKTAKLSSSLNNDDDYDDGDVDDDAFLYAALAKARRLQRLRELNGVKVVGEEAVIHAVEQMKRKEEEEDAATAAAENIMDGGDLEADVMTNKSDRITFEVNEIQEFTRALRARDNEDQSSSRRSNNSIDGGIIIGEIGEEDGKEERRGSGKPPSHVLTVPDANNIVATSLTLKAESGVVESTNMKTDDYGDDVTDMEEMARDMEVDDASIINNDHDDLGHDGDDTTSGGLTREAPIGGRGMSSFLSHLRHTGEIRNHSTKEEMRGRAKDKRTYEDYEKLDLSSVVKIGTNGTAPHEKDAELARREIKLEYRDEHGRLLTRKEAYRDMCYQFHGHGSSKKNQERRLKQIEKERTENSNGGTAGPVGTLGALKATQKATGKAFIIHKT